jgi:glycosyltransferase involved in cell wall biosynthesis
VLAQDFRDAEVLISDDGSTDDSAEIIKKYAARDARVRWWKNSRNLGLTENANVCLRAARGEYIKFVHQDDKLLSALAIKKMVAALDENPAAALTGSRQHLTGTTSRPTIFSNRSGCFEGRRMIVTCLEQNTNLIGQPTLVMFRQRLARRGFDERFTSSMDFEMWCHLLEQGDYAYLHEPLATWRVHQNHRTARARANGSLAHEHLQFMEIYYSKPWLQELATERMRFTQIYYLRKKYGERALNLTSAIRSEFSPGHQAWWWLKHKISRPFFHASRKLNQLRWKAT